MALGVVEAEVEVVQRLLPSPLMAVAVAAAGVAEAGVAEAAVAVSLVVVEAAAVVVVPKETGQMILADRRWCYR